MLNSWYRYYCYLCNKYSSKRVYREIQIIKVLYYKYFFLLQYIFGSVCGFIADKPLLWKLVGIIVKNSTTQNETKRVNNRVIVLYSVYEMPKTTI